MRKLLLILLLACSWSNFALAAEWPQFRGPQGNGQADVANLPVRWRENENIAWKTAIHGNGWSSPVVCGDQVWLTTATEDGRKMYAVCVDLSSGKIVHDVLLFSNAAPRDIRQYNSFASPTPVIEEGRVYIHFGSYGAACLDTKTANVIWQRRDLPCDHHRGPASSPILFEKKLILVYDGYDYQYVVALDKNSGEIVWKADREVNYGTDDGDVMKAYATPHVIEIDGQLQLIAPTSKAIVAYNPRSGEELWQVRHAQFSTAGRPVYGHGLLFISTGFGKSEMWAVRPGGSGDLTDTHVAWKVTKSIGSKPSPVLIGDLLFQIHDQGVASCIEAKTGEEQWSERLGGKYSSSLLAAGGHVYFFSEDGRTTVIKPGREYEEVASNQLGDPKEATSGFMASPAVAGDSLILRSRSHLYRIQGQQP